jgi:hypothetical protein
MSIESNCSYPCWYEIRPGLTNYDRSIEILNSISFINNKSFSDKYYEGFSKTLFWNAKGFAFLSNSGYLYYHDDRVSSIEINPGVFDTVKLENALNFYGVPDNVVVILSNSERRYILSIIIYSDGVALVTEDKLVGMDDRSPEYSFNGSTKLSSIIYFDPENISDLGRIGHDCVARIFYSRSHNNYAIRIFYIFDNERRAPSRQTT